MSKPLSKQTAQRPAERVSLAKAPFEAPALEQAPLVEEAGPPARVNHPRYQLSSIGARQSHLLSMKRSESQAGMFARVSKQTLADDGALNPARTLIKTC